MNELPKYLSARNNIYVIQITVIFLVLLLEIYVFGKQNIKESLMHHFLSATMKLHALKRNKNIAKIKHMVDRNYTSKKHIYT